VDATPGAGAEFAGKHAVHRGGAFGDLDGDGRVDAVVTALDEPVELWRNMSPAANHWLAVRLRGRRSNRDGIGTEVEVETAAGRQHGHAVTTVGYGGASDVKLHFGLGRADVVKAVRLRWPSGAVQVVENVKANQVLVVEEPEQ
jgi:hypothetical protein